MAWVHDVMTRRVIGVAPAATVSEVLELSTSRDLDYLPVLDHGRLIGLISREDLGEVRLTALAAEVLHEPITVSVDATLDEAAALMNERDVGCLLVTDDLELYGIVTRGDLVRAGVPEEQVVGERRCSACGTHHHVHLRPPGDLMLCGSCAERGRAPAVDDELGVAG